jgi:hypothetical protein
LVVLAETPAPPTEASAVAVLPLEVHGASLTPDESRAATELLAAECGMPTVPGAMLRAEIERRKLASYNTSFDASTQIALGNAIAAQKILVGQWLKLATRCHLTVALTDLRTELQELVLEEEVSCGPSELAKAIRAVGARLRSRAEQRADFRLELSEARKTRNPPTDEKGYVRIHARARGSPAERLEVWINGEQRGTVLNGFFTSELPIGHYVILLRVAGDTFVHQRLEIDLGSAGIELGKDRPIELLPVFGTLKLEGTPAEVRIKIDDNAEPVRLPWEKRLRMGRHVLTIEAPGYVPHEAEPLDIKPGQQVVVRYALKRNVGGLSVRGEPSNARVFIDDVDSGPLPFESTAMDVGPHVVELRAAGHHAERKMVTITLDGRTEVALSLSPKPARLKVEALARIGGEPGAVEADLFIDGQRVGTTPWKGTVVAEVDHEILLQMAGVRGPARRVRLEEGAEQAMVVEVPAAWGGASAGLLFDLPKGPWELRAGGVPLAPEEENKLRPGPTKVDLFLDGHKVAEVNRRLAPGTVEIVHVVARPRTNAELEFSQDFWGIRRWVAFGLTAAATGVAGHQLVAAHMAESQRDAAYAALRTAGVSLEVDAYRAAVVDREDARVRSETVAAFGLGAAAAFATWATIEWLWGEPTRGVLVGDGLEVNNP